VSNHGLSSAVNKQKTNEVRRPGSNILKAFPIFVVMKGWCNLLDVVLCASVHPKRPPLFLMTDRFTLRWLGTHGVTVIAVPVLCSAFVAQ